MRLSLLVVSLVIFALLQNNVHAKCLSYNDGDAYPSDNSSYCLNILQWDVSESTLTTYSARDAEALSNYTTFYNNYYKLGLVDIDCLGMANYFFCAKAYPTCDSSHDQIDSICSWLCELFTVRCGTNNQFYQAICQYGTQSSQTCSFQNNLSISIAIFLGFVLVLLLF